MTNDTIAIRAQYSDGEYLDAYPGEACATILALCDETERLRADNERLRGTLFAISVASMDDFCNCGSIARAALAQKGGE